MGSESGSRFVLLGGYGLLLLIVGAALRFWPGLAGAGIEIALGAAGFALLGLGATWLARTPRLGALVGVVAVGVAVWGLGVALAVAVLPDAMALEALPRGLELVGGALWLSATAGHQMARLERGWVETPAPPRGKFERTRPGGVSGSASAQSLVAGDRIRLSTDDEIPADGRLVEGAISVEERRLYAAHEPRLAQVGDRVFAGTRVVDGEGHVEVLQPFETSLIVERGRRLDELRLHVLETGRLARVAAIGSFVLAAAIVGLGIWLEMRSAAPAHQRLATTHLAVFLAVFPGAALIAFARGRAAALEAVMARGVWFTRPGDAAAFFGVRHWRVDPMLLAAPGPVEVLAFRDVPGTELLRWTEAVARPWRGPERISLHEACVQQRLEPTEAAAVKENGGLRYGTVDGRRVIIGAPEAFESERDLRLDGDQAAAIRFLRDRPTQVWLVASDAEGLLGAVGIGITAEPGAKASLRGLQARLLPTLEEASLRAVATAADANARPKAPKRGDASLLATETDAPSRGLRVRVVDSRTEIRLTERAAPRVLRAALPHFAETVRRGLDLRRRARWRGWLVPVGCTVVAAALVGGRVFEPAFGALVGRLGLLFAFTPYGDEPAPRGD
jgi:hypothetical protein